MAVAEQQQPLPEGVLVGLPGPLLARVVLDGQGEDVEQPGQGMVMAALGNELTGGRLQRYFTSGPVERAVRPLLAMEAFTAGG